MANILTGPRGGKYWIDDNGKKHYVTSKKTTKTSKKEPKESTYICYFRQLDEDGEVVDDFKEWTTAYSEQEARAYFEHEHWRSIAAGRLEIDMIVEE